MNRKPVLPALAMSIAATGLVLPQTRGIVASQKGRVERIKVHGTSLEGNLEGDSPDRDVSICLRPQYDTDRSERFPVVYLLHGFTNSDDGWYGPNTRAGFQSARTTLPAVADRAITSGSTRAMILVMPNAQTIYQGSMYSNSVTTGNWEAYITQDLVSYVDTHYRTIPRRASRGLAGHSMGGYGTIRIAMKYPDVFSSIYLMSACCLKPGLNPEGNWGSLPWQSRGAEAVRTAADVASADRGTITVLAESAAWSPNPKNPPFFFDLPSKDGKIQPDVEARWAANAPLTMIDQDLPNLKTLHAISIDVGDKDGLAGNNKQLSRILTHYGVANTFELYDGDHTNRMALRVETKVLPFFSTNLSFDTTKR
jgi:S-formylglutathione hydrolase